MPFSTSTKQHLNVWLRISLCLALAFAWSSRSSETKEEQDIETIKTDTNLVTVPVVATDSKGGYVADLTKAELVITEEGVKQNIAFFASVSTPFHVVLMLDTSASTRDDLTPIKRAALAFVQQLQTTDRVKVISFDDQVRDRNDFTSDRKELEAAILQTESGQGTRLYDAIEQALTSLRTIKGRKAIVLFSDGVDFRSESANFDSTLRNLDEEGIIVYPIRYDTRKETERIAREQSQNTGVTLPTLDVIRLPSSGTTAPTFPNDDPGSVGPPTIPRQTGPLGLPLPEDILRRRRDREDFPTDNRRPPPSGREDPPPRRELPTSKPRQPDNSIGAMLDQMYATADSYLAELANKSGGKILRADLLRDLPEAFRKIAAELRIQYLVGYYPLQSPQSGQYRRIKVTTSRNDVAIRSKPGYRVRANPPKR